MIPNSGHVSDTAMVGPRVRSTDGGRTGNLEPKARNYVRHQRDVDEELESADGANVTLQPVFKMAEILWKLKQKHAQYFLE